MPGVGSLLLNDRTQVACAEQACTDWFAAWMARTWVSRLGESDSKTAEGAEALCKEMDELRRKGDEERVGFELQLAGARNVKAARALLADHDNDIEKLKAAEPWLFSAPAAPTPTGATGLPSAGAAGADESTQMSRWRRIRRPSRERGVADGKQHRIHQELHGRPGRGSTSARRARRA